MEPWTSFLVLFAAGFIAGTVNVIAGGGSFLTLPILIFLGFPAIVANGTNRVGLLFQNVGAVWGFHRHRILNWQSLVWAAVPAAIGSVGGVWIAFSVGDETFRRVLAFLMVVLTLWSLWSHGRGLREGEGSRWQAASRGVLIAGFFVAGVYAGFVQAGVGFLVLALTTYAGLDLVRGNAVKVLSILVLIAVSLSLFAWQDKVDWLTGLVLGAGMLLGGQLGVKLTILKGHKWIRGVVTLTVLVFALKLWLGP
jgi:uncharacterized membrane protein YfcA